MGCGCGKPKGTIDKPFTAGRHNGATPVEGTLLVSYGGASPGTKVWVTGDGIDLWVAKGYLALTDSLVSPT
jgi:hypothetical protein